MVKKLITPFLLVLVALLSWGYIKTLDESLSQHPTASNVGPDYYMYDTVSTLLDEAGEPKHRLETAYLAHFPEENRTELKDANLTIYQKDGSMWTVKANQGTLYQDTEQIYLAGNVVIERPEEILTNKEVTHAPGQAETQRAGVPSNDSLAGLKIETDQLHIDPNLKVAQTTDPVVISSQDSRVNAVGMKANLQTKSVELMAKVKGIYVPPRELSR